MDTSAGLWIRPVKNGKSRSTVLLHLKRKESQQYCLLVIPAWLFALYSSCKSAGIKVNGTKTSDVICNEESKTNTHTTTDPTSKSVVRSLFSHVTSHRPHEGAQTQKTLTTTTTSAPGHSNTPMPGIVSSNKSNHFGKARVAVMVGTG